MRLIQLENANLYIILNTIIDQILTNEQKTKSQINVWVGPAKSVTQISPGWALSSAGSF